MLRILSLVAVTLMGCAGGTKCAEVTASRCAGAVAQVCSSERRWEDVMDCDRIAALAEGGEPWMCCAVETAPRTMTFGCAPVSRCASGGAQ